MFRYKMHYADGSEAGDAAYADNVRPGDQIMLGPGRFVRVLAAVTTVCERGWRAFLTDGEFESAEVAILCPACAKREFGDGRRLTRADEDL